MGEQMSPVLLDHVDLSAWLGEPITEPADVSRAAAMIQYAFDVINSFTGRSNAYWFDNGLPSAVRSVSLMLASYGYTNPDWWANERVDDWGAGGRPVQEIGLALTPENKNMLRPYVKRASLGIGVLDTSRPVEVAVEAPWFDPVTGGINDWGQ